MNARIVVLSCIFCLMASYIFAGSAGPGSMGSSSMIEGYEDQSSLGETRALSCSDWPMFRNTLNHTAFCSHDTAGNWGHLLWKFKTGGKIQASPTIGPDGTIYIGSHDRTFYAVNQDGTEKWNYTVPSVNGTIRWSSAAISSNGTLYFGTDDSKLYAIDPDGTKLWDYVTNGPVWSSPAIDGNGTIYFGSADNFVYALNPNGTLKWKYHCAGIVRTSPAVGPQGTVYVGVGINALSTGNLVALNSNGTLKWDFTMGYFTYSSPTISPNGTIYVGSLNNFLYAIKDMGNIGQLLWNYQTNGNIDSSPALAPDGTIYVGSNDRNLYALDPNGALKWSFKATGEVRSSPSIASEGTIYFSCLDRSQNETKAAFVFGVYPNGSEKWRYPMDNGVQSSPAIDSNGTVYVGAFDHKLYALNYGEPDWPMFRFNRTHCAYRDVDVSNNQGRQKWSFQTSGGPFGVGEEVYSSPAIGGGNIIYSGCNDTNIYAVFGNNGTMKWSYQTNREVTSSPAIGVDGTIYVGSNDDHLYALYPNGLLKWKADTQGDVRSSPMVCPDGTIVVGSDNYTVHAYNPDGTVKWIKTTGGEVRSSPAFANGTIYVGSNDHYLYALNPNNGNTNWSFQADDKITSSPAVNPWNGDVIFGSEDGYLYIRDNLGNKRDEYQFPCKIISSVAVWDWSPSDSHYNVYLVDSSGILYGIYVDNGGEYPININWTFTVSPTGHAYSSPVIGPGKTVVVGGYNSGGGIVTAVLDVGSTATAAWYFYPRGGVSSSPCIGDNGRVYFGSDDFRLYAIK